MRRKMWTNLWKRKIKTFYGAVAFLMFFLMISTVGAVECDTVSLHTGTIRSFIFLILWVLFTYLAGGFKEYQQTEKDRRTNATKYDGPYPKHNYTKVYQEKGGKSSAKFL
jgi:hypothetical protein